MKVLLTGSTGLLGSHIAEELLRQNAKVTALVRTIPQKSFLGQNKDKYAAQLQLIEGDLHNFSTTENYDAVIHCAAMTSVDHSQKEEIWKVNFEGTKYLQQSLQGKYSKWVQISSVSTLCDGSQKIVDESFQGQARKTPYAESKLAADQWLMGKDSSALVIHPCYMLGKWDSKPSSGAVFHAMKFKKITSYQNNKKNFVAASDVAHGIYLGLQKSLSGHYLLGHENVEIKKFFQSLAKEMNVPFDLKEETLTADSPDWAKEFCASSEVDYSKAKKEMGYQPKLSLEVMLKETMDYFEEFKMLRRAKS